MTHIRELTIENLADLQLTIEEYFPDYKFDLNFDYGMVVLNISRDGKDIDKIILHPASEIVYVLFHLKTYIENVLGKDLIYTKVARALNEMNRSLLRYGNEPDFNGIIARIKAFRAITGASLKEAKEYIEANEVNP